MSKTQHPVELLRFNTCGSVDDGKSTLIGRMLYESHMLFDDHLAALEADSKKDGTQGGEIDFALLVDGLAAEREQGITIDVAYRFFSTDKRKYIVADTPGHEEYTRNMATGASTADVAIILVDASQGILTQTRRHSFIVSMVGVKRIVLAVNKLDLVNYSQEVFEEIAQRIERNLKCSVEIMDNSQEVEMMADYLLNLYGSDGLHAPDNLHMAFSVVHKTTLFSCDYKLINVCKKNNTPCINTHKLATGEGIRIVKSKYAKIVKTFKPKIQSSLLKPGEKIVWRSFV